MQRHGSLSGRRKNVTLLVGKGEEGRRQLLPPRARCCPSPRPTLEPNPAAPPHLALTHSAKAKMQVRRRQRRQRLGRSQHAQAGTHPPSLATVRPNRPPSTSSWAWLLPHVMYSLTTKTNGTPPCAPLCDKVSSMLLLPFLQYRNRSVIAHLVICLGLSTSSSVASVYINSGLPTFSVCLPTNFN